MEHIFILFLHETIIVLKILVMIYEKIIPINGHSFEKRDFSLKHFPIKWHHHDEYELVLITSGNGQRYIGDIITKFEEGDLVLIAPNIPHFHLSAPEYFENNNLLSKSQVIFFTNSIFPVNMDSSNEFRSINKMFKSNFYFIKFDKDTLDNQLMEKIKTLDHREGFKMLIQLYEILHTLSLTKYQVYEKRFDTKPELNARGEDIDNRVYSYLINNFKEKITLNQIAEYAGLCPGSLCRRFKQIAGKSLFTYLNDIRIEFSYKLLSESLLPISTIAYESGFQNISNFNRIFLKNTGITPAEYRKQHYKNPNK